MQNKVRVEARHVAMSYGATQVLRGIDLVIEPGEFFALLGPSGSGKSTLLRLIAGFNHAQSGQLLIDGEDVSRVPPWRRNVGMVFQNYALWPHMTVSQNVAFGLEERRLPKAAIGSRVKAALELVGLQDYGARRPAQLSGGQQQRVALARTIAIEPKVLLLDEPLSNLDAKLRVHMRSELLQLQRKLGITTIFVTHDQEEALSISDRVAVLDGGVIQQIGTPMELYDRPANRFIADFVGTINLISGRVEQTAAGATLFAAQAIGAIPLPHPVPPGPADLAIRPHAIALAPGGTADHPGWTWIDGTVAEREFLGEFVRYGVSVRGTALVVDIPHHADSALFDAGSAVRVGINPQQCRVLPV